MRNERNPQVNVVMKQEIVNKLEKIAEEYGVSRCQTVIILITKAFNDLKKEENEVR